MTTQFALKIENLVKTFPSPDGGTLRVLDLPVFEMMSGEHVALSGESGCGKTTLLHLIAGILAPDSGRIFVDDALVSEDPPTIRDQLRATTIGYLFQTFNLLPGFTAIENVELAMRLGRGWNPALAESLLDKVGLGDRMHHRPAQLSVGQQQRVALVRALANRPRLVLADEPTGNLDPKHGGDALELIRAMCREIDSALLLVSHDRDVISQFERSESLDELNAASIQ